MTIKTLSQLKEAADMFVVKTLNMAKIKADQNTEIANVKTRHKIDVAERTKDIKSLGGKLKRWIDKNPTKIFGDKGTGTLKTKISIITLHQKAPKLESIDDLSEADKIELIRSKGHSNCVVTKEVISIESLEKLTDEQLERCGYTWKKGTTINVAPNLDKEDAS